MSTIDADAGPLDVDALARLANQYFSEWTGAAAQTPEPSVPPGLSFDSQWASVSPGIVGLPGEAELRALRATLGT